MRVIVTAGGTGGHIYPALALIDEIKRRDPTSEFLYIGTHDRMERDIVPTHGITFEYLTIYGFQKSLKLLWKDFADIFLIPASLIKARKLIKRFKPDVVVAFGGYVTYPVIREAKKLGIKTFIHEQNSIPGKANKALLKYTDLIGVSFPESLKYFEGFNAIVTGNPVASQSIEIKKKSKEDFGLSKDKKGILIFNGSLGSRVVNKKFIPILQNMKKEKYEVLYVTGKNYYDEMNAYEFPKNVILVPYVDNISGLMKDMDLVISRAGASTVAEIEALGIPTIFIPSPYVANNHQYYNALAIQNENAGLMLEEKDLTEENIKRKIDLILENEKLRMEFKKNLKRLAQKDSASIIYENLKKLIEK